MVSTTSEATDGVHLGEVHDCERDGKIGAYVSVQTLHQDDGGIKRLELHSPTRSVIKMKRREEETKKERHEE